MRGEATIGAHPSIGRRPFILDARLALRRGGLVFALQLARERPVWLVRSFWTLVDSAYFYQRFPGELHANPSDEQTHELLESLSHWHASWLYGALNGAFFWVGDARRESAVPAHADADLMARYERLASSLDDGLDACGAAPTMIEKCGREAVALAAALSVEAPIILTSAGGAARNCPPICHEVGHGCAMEVFGPDETAGDYLDRALPEKARDTARQLERLGVRIAVVQAFAPGALAVSGTGAAVEELRAEADESPVDRKPWSGACLFWTG